MVLRLMRLLKAFLIKFRFPNKHTIINFSINNILNDKREDFFEAYNAQDQIFNQFTPGTEVGLGIKYEF